MTHQKSTSTSFSKTLHSVLVVLVLTVPFTGASARQAASGATEQEDSIPLFNGFSVAVDLVGPAMLMFSDYGEYEASCRLNLRNRCFPIVEVGYGKAERTDEVTEIYYKTGAPYFRIGCDWNLLKNKNTGNRLFGGFRYAYTSYEVDIAKYDMTDPVWYTETEVEVMGEKCNQHWLEAVVGIDAKIAGPLHLGWTFRWKRRVSHKDTSIGKVWYVPGYGTRGSTRLAVNFNVIIDI